jgi:hypothetical protein
VHEVEPAEEANVLMGQKVQDDESGENENEPGGQIIQFALKAEEEEFSATK